MSVAYQICGAFLGIGEENEVYFLEMLFHLDYRRYTSENAPFVPVKQLLLTLKLI